MVENKYKYFSITWLKQGSILDIERYPALPCAEFSLAPLPDLSERKAQNIWA